MRKWSRAAVVFLVSALAASAVPAVAHDHKPPRAILRSPGDEQRGRAWSSDWTRADGKFCVSGVGDGIPNYRRKAMTWNPSNPIRLYLYKKQKPKKVKVRMHRRLDEDGSPQGKGRRARIRLRDKVLDNGRRIWIAKFRGPDVRHLFLSARAVWQDVEGCNVSQSLDFAFHLRRR